MTLTEIITHGKLMPLIFADNPAQVVEDASIYRAAGYGAVEILCRTPHAIEGIAETCRQLPGLLVGAGTVLSLAMAEQAAQAGAKFLVSPAADPVIMAFAQAQNLEMVPGVYSPTDVAVALRHGFRVQKMFPSEPGGLTRLDAFASPFTHTGLRIVAGHGISRELAPQYLKHPLVAGIIADWLPGLRSTALREELAQTKAWLKSL